jgi:hypothetical protein
MTTPLGNLGLSFARRNLSFLLLNYICRTVFFLLVVAMLSLSSFIYLFIYFCSFYYFSMHCVSCLS